MCGSTDGQKQVASTTQQNLTTAQQQSQSVFGDSTAAYNDLAATFLPTIAAGPGQQGYSNQELSNLDSQAITQVGQEAKNEKVAVGSEEAAQGGGTSVLPGGATTGANLTIAENAGNQTASELSGITQAGYAQGEKNYDTAVSGLEGAPGVFSPSTAATNATSTAGNTAGQSAEDVAQSDQSPWTAALGAAGSLGGAALGAWAKKP